MLSTPTLSAKPVHEMTQEEVRANIERIITSSPEMQQYAHNIGIDVSWETRSYGVELLWLWWVLLAAGNAARRSRIKKDAKKAESITPEVVENVPNKLKNKIQSIQDGVLTSTPENVSQKSKYTTQNTTVSPEVVYLEDESLRIRQKFLQHPWFHEKQTAIEIQPFFQATNGYMFDPLDGWIESDGVWWVHFQKTYHSIRVDLRLLEDTWDGLQMNISLSGDMKKNYLSIASDGFIKWIDKDGQSFQIRPTYAIQRNPATLEITLLVWEWLWISQASQILLDSTFAKSGSSFTLYAPYLF